MCRCARAHRPLKASKVLREGKGPPSPVNRNLYSKRDITIVDTHGIWPYAQYKHFFIIIDVDESLEFRSGTDHICTLFHQFHR